MKRKVLAGFLSFALLTPLFAPKVFAATASCPSTVTVSGLRKYGICGTYLTGASCRARMVIDGSLSDRTANDRIDTYQVSGWYTSSLYEAHYVDGNGVLFATK